MIIFDLDGTLADIQHRLHFITPPDETKHVITDSIPHNKGCILTGEYRYKCGKKWEPDWKAFYEACDKDKPVEHTRHVMESLFYQENTIEIWSGRCESIRDKTEIWINKHLGGMKRIRRLVMRTKGDSTPDDVLTESWLDFTLQEQREIHYVFDDRKKVIDMWRRRGIFVFDCDQTGE